MPSQRPAWIIFIALVLAACEATVETTPTALPIAQVRPLATVFISPTPDAEQAEATRQASSPTPLPPTPSVVPTETPYIGIFVGEAPGDSGMQSFTEPIFGDDVVAEPTANLTVCAIPIDGAYITAWRTDSVVRRRMGCPIQAGFGFFGDAQLFENGIMYRRPENNTVWAILSGSGQGEYFVLENLPQIATIDIRPPDGLLLPTDEFADMWLTVEGLRNQIGFAQTESNEIPLGAQRFENGTFLFDADAGQVYALIVDGTSFGPFDAAPGAEPGVAPGQTVAPAQSLTPEVTATATEVN